MSENSQQKEEIYGTPILDQLAKEKKFPSPAVLPEVVREVKEKQIPSAPVLPEVVTEVVVTEVKEKEKFPLRGTPRREDPRAPLRDELLPTIHTDTTEPVPRLPHVPLDERDFSENGSDPLEVEVPVDEDDLVDPSNNDE